VPGQNLAIGLLVCAVAIAVAVFSHGWVTASGGDESVGIGPLGVEVCEDGQCQSVGWGDMGPRVPGDLQVFGYLTLIGGLVGAALAAACALMIFQRTPNKAPWKPARAVLSAASGFAAFLEIRIFTMGEGGMGGAGPGWAIFVGLGGLITGGILASKISPLANTAGGGGFGPAPGANPYGPYGAAPGPNPGANPYAAAPQVNPYGAAPGTPPQAQPAAMATAPTAAAAPATTTPAGQPTYPCPRCQKSLVFVAQYQRWFCESCKQYA
jgi:hypothetical protein